jgi:thioredoxin-like negative regulator of GroEL
VGVLALSRSFRRFFLETWKPRRELSAARTLLLLFFNEPQSGPARRMESPLAHLAREERDRLRVARVDVAKRPEAAEKLNVDVVPRRS